MSDLASVVAVQSVYERAGCVILWRDYKSFKLVVVGFLKLASNVYWGWGGRGHGHQMVSMSTSEYRGLGSASALWPSGLPV